MLGSSRVAAELAASREGLGSMSDDDDSLCMSLPRAEHSLPEETLVPATARPVIAHSLHLEPWFVACMRLTNLLLIAWVLDFVHHLVL
jgi:hypothetical protein